MGPQMEMRIKYLLFGLLLGIAATVFIGFKWGGWSTSKTTQKLIEGAVLTKEGTMCADQYLRTPNNKAKLKEFENVGNSQRSEFIEKGGWDKMPGQENADFGVSRSCVEVLEDRLKT